MQKHSSLHPHKVAVRNTSTNSTLLCTPLQQKKRTPSQTPPSSVSGGFSSLPSMCLIGQGLGDLIGQGLSDLIGQGLSNGARRPSGGSITRRLAHPATPSAATTPIHLSRPHNRVRAEKGNERNGRGDVEEGGRAGRGTERERRGGGLAAKRPPHPVHLISLDLSVYFVWFIFFFGGGGLLGWMGVWKVWQFATPPKSSVIVCPGSTGMLPTPV